jgi:hypothetical protein
VNFDAGKKAGEVRHETRQPTQTLAPQAMRQSVQEKRMDTGIAGENLPGGTRRWITIEYRTNIFAQTPKHGR